LRDLEWLSGVRYNTIWRIEAGRPKRTHRSTVQKLANALGVEPSELMKGLSLVGGSDRADWLQALSEVDDVRV
jgi:transcriptional regulator with XRE-family HTH domain